MKGRKGCWSELDAEFLKGGRRRVETGVYFGGGGGSVPVFI